MSEVIRLRLADKIQEGEKVKAILSIDAIEIALFQKVNDLIKNIFLMLLIPTNMPEKPFLVKALTHQNGKVRKDILEIINEKILQTFIDHPFVDLQYKAVDGDNGYNDEFEDEFEVIFRYFNDNGIEGLSEFIDQLKIDMLEQKKKWLKLFLYDTFFEKSKNPNDNRIIRT